VKVCIIGAGVSGLSAGCYLQMNGFETEIFEKQSCPGGLCASWKRGEYTFDGCIHWIMGTNDSNPFYRLWSELIDMKSVEFVNHEERIEIELEKNRDRHGNGIFHLYSNIERLKAYLLDIAPEDAKPIGELIHCMKMMQRYEMPPMIEYIPERRPLRKKLVMITYLPLVYEYYKWRNVTNLSFARKLKNPFLKEAFELIFDGEEWNMLVLIMPLSISDTKGTGYPVGGSSKFISHIVEKYESLGGKIHYNQKVKKILTEGQNAKGIQLEDNRIVNADVTISAADWHFTNFDALEERFIDAKLRALIDSRKLKVYPSVMLISLGVNRSFKEYPHLIRFPLSGKLVSPDGTTYSRLESHIYHYDPEMAPEGKTIMVVSLYTYEGDYWINLRKKDISEYTRQKMAFATEIVDLLDQRMEGAKQAVEVIDVATPATYNRYTNNWKGSAQGWYPSSNLLAKSPVSDHLQGLSDFYFCSQWLMPGGGLPVTIKTARDLAQKICLKYKRPFVIR
jgi:phytoene dehydrogenase-like protein